MAKVLCISSQTVFGPVGNSAAAPALQSSGHEVLQVPTVLLSNHPGLGAPAGQSTTSHVMAAIFDALKAVTAFEHLAAVMTGYFTSAEQVIATAKQIADLKAQHQHLHVLVDPVIGDHGKLYVAVDVAETIRNVLLPLATITTPNLFELTWLAGTDDIKSAIRKLSVPETIVTSVPQDSAHLMTKLYLAEQHYSHSIPRQSNVPNGTGDFLSGCYLAERLNHPAPEAFAKAMQRVENAVVKSLGRRALNLSETPSP
jgi:pyridoxine kinase